MSIYSRMVNIHFDSTRAGAALEAAELAGAQPAARQPASVGVFVTPQSLMTFPVASTVVTLIWKVLAKVFPAWGAPSSFPSRAGLSSAA